MFAESAFTSHVDMSKRWNSNAAISGGGVLIDNGTHSVDILRYFLGNLRDIQIIEGRRMQGLPVEDTVRLFVHNDEGVMGSADLSWSIDKELETYLRLYGSNGTILVGWKESKYRRHGEPEWHTFGTGYDKIQAFRDQIENFCGAVAATAISSLRRRMRLPPSKSSRPPTRRSITLAGSGSEASSRTWSSHRALRPKWHPKMVHPTAIIEPNVLIGRNTAIWDHVHVRHSTRIGDDCVIGEKTYIAYGVSIGDRVKINAFVYICTEVTIERGVMISAGTVFTNDRNPRATTPDLAACCRPIPTKKRCPPSCARGQRSARTRRSAPV